MSTHARLGGTSIAALMGEDNFGRTPRDIYNQIVLGKRGFATKYMRRGNALEREVRRRYVEETGATLEPHPGIVHWGECFAASVDDLRERDGVKGVVDYKTASASVTTMAKWKSGLLPSYEWQLRLYMPVFSRAESDLFVAFGIDLEGPAAEARPLAERYVDIDGVTRAFEIVETRLFTVHRDEDKERRLIQVGIDFWRNHVVPKIPPDGPPIPEPLPTTRIAVVALSAADLKRLESLDEVIN